MRTRIYATITALLLMALAAPAMAQYATLKGKTMDETGQPYVGATIHMSDKETGHKYDLKTDKTGHFQSIAITSGRYEMVLIVDGKELYTLHGVRVSLSVEENIVDFDMKKFRAEDVKSGAVPAMTEEKKKELEAAKAEYTGIKQLNEMMAQAHTASEAGNHADAIAIMKKATELGGKYDMIWARLGETYLLAAKKNTDREEKKAQYSEAANAYKKASDMAAAPGANAQSKSALGDYYNNLGEAYAQIDNIEEATKAYSAAAAADAPNAGQYFYNLGAHLTNKNRPDEALKAYDHAIAADPAKANAYYQKGVTLLQKATTAKDGKIAPAPGTVEALQKYLELEPEGKHAQEAKDMLAYLGTKLETTYGKKKK